APLGHLRVADRSGLASERPVRRELHHSWIGLVGRSQARAQARHEDVASDLLGPHVDRDGAWDLRLLGVRTRTVDKDDRALEVLAKDSLPPVADHDLA